MRILVTAGPTREFLDPVRFLSNPSSGKMGYAIAAEAKRLRHQVELVSGPVSLTPPRGVKVTSAISAKEMARIVWRSAKNADIIIMAAAVGDFEFARPLNHKLKKTEASLTVTLKRTPDILATLGRRKKAGQILVGFAAETKNLNAYAKRKLKEKNLDWIVANNVKKPGIGFGSDDNAVTLLDKQGRSWQFGPASKQRIARQILKQILMN